MLCPCHRNAAQPKGKHHVKPQAKFCQVLISAELRTQGMRLLEHLISRRLIFGGPVLSGPARFLWKNEIVEHDYCWVVTFTREDLKDELIRAAEKESAEAICMISSADSFSAARINSSFRSSRVKDDPA